MLYKYKATTADGKVREGELEAVSQEIALRSLQKRNLLVVSIEVAKKGKMFFSKNLSILGGVKQRDVVIFSRQLSTLFEAKVPALTSFKLLASETENPALRKILGEIVEDISGGIKISQALTKHPKVFSSFFINMVRAGEEAGKLEQVFNFMAAYLERSYELTSKAVRALMYPAFVTTAFVAVMILMMTVVIPKLTEIIKESEIDTPFYTKVVIASSDFVRSYGLFFVIPFIIGLVFLWQYTRTAAGKDLVSRIQLKLPFLGNFFKKLYASRIADNLRTLITGGVSMVRSIEITAQTVDNRVYKSILLETTEAVKSGSPISETFRRYEVVPPLLTQMVKIGEETGKLDFILETLAKFYAKEVDAALETLVGLIEPIMIVVLGGGVGILLASVLVPIYNVAMAV